MTGFNYSITKSFFFFWEENYFEIYRPLNRLPGRQYLLAFLGQHDQRTSNDGSQPSS